jgi:hypothetical protein
MGCEKKRKRERRSRIVCRSERNTIFEMKWKNGIESKSRSGSGQCVY